MSVSFAIATIVQKVKEKRIQRIKERRKQMNKDYCRKHILPAITVSFGVKGPADCGVKPG